MSDQVSVKEILEGALGNRADAVNHNQKTEKKWEKYLKSLNKQNKMVFIMAKRFGSCRGLNKIKKIQARESRRRN